jgi:hypothetical protein
MRQQNLLIGLSTTLSLRLSIPSPICIENSVSGKGLFEALKEITAIDPENIQFCCAEWFWERQINSYALQVEPDRFKRKDAAIIDFKESLHIEKIRNLFFIRLYELLENAKEK